MAKELEQYGLENLRLVDSRSYEVNCNVKVLLDAFLEVYHLKSIHQQTVDRFLDHRGMFVTLRSEEHTSELQSLMRISYAVFCLKKKTKILTKEIFKSYQTH